MRSSCLELRGMGNLIQLGSYVGDVVVVVALFSEVRIQIHTEIGYENPLANLDWKASRTAECVNVTFLTRNSRGSYSIITSPWPN